MPEQQGNCSTGTSRRPRLKRCACLHPPGNHTEDRGRCHAEGCFCIEFTDDAPGNQSLRRAVEGRKMRARARAS